MREYLDKVSMYGSRISVIRHTTSSLPFNSNFADIIIVNSKKKISADLPETIQKEMMRVVRPFGGVICFIHRDSILALNKKGAPPSAGQWTHLYADPSNTVCSQDSIKGPFQLHWFGRPGPKHIVNRHSRPMSPLFGKGRLFIPGNNRIIAVDAYNGTLLWEKEVQAFRRLGALKDCGQMALCGDSLYAVASSACHVLHTKDGSETMRIPLPRTRSGLNLEWSYLAVMSRQIFGSAQCRGATFSRLGRLNCDQFEGDFRKMVGSRMLFGMERKSGREKWRYTGIAVLNGCIAVGPKALYFIESRDKKVIRNSTGRFRVDHFLNTKTYLVKLNAKTGKPLWKRHFRFPFNQIVNVSYSMDIVLVTGSYNFGKYVNYGLYAFAASSGNTLWENTFKGQKTGGTHGEQWQRPVIIGETVYLRPFDFNLKTGKKGTYQLNRGGGNRGCGGLSGSLKALFGRGSNPRYYPITKREESGIPLTRITRPGCWINIIPAGGLIMIPESSSGCTCDYSVQGSIVFSPLEN
jgi:outer membrane protein assembly factor BamB